MAFTFGEKKYFKILNTIIKIVNVTPCNLKLYLKKQTQNS